LQPLIVLIKRVGSIFLSLIFCVVCALSVAGFFGAQSDFCELCSHFRLVWCCLLIFLVAFLSIAKLRTFVAIALIVFAANLFDVLRLYVPEFTANSGSGGPRIRILQMNLNGHSNHNYDAAVAAIAAKRPDVVALSEVNDDWVARLNNRLVDYPYRRAAPQYQGVALYSRLPIAQAETRINPAVGRPRIYAHLRLDNRDIVIDFAHPLLPVIAKFRNDELDQLGQEARNTTLPFILVGDLNCTPWSYYFHKLLKTGMLHDTESGFGPQPTWCADMFVPVLPIDHCLVSSGFRTITRTVGPDVGSDQLPVYVELLLLGGKPF
jgi:endonuclease/exonuclease/phosphatase (EEP) superfamily protein YafD